VRRSAFVVVIAVALQMMLGIMTLLAQVPLSLGLLHQGGGELVLAAAVWHLHAARTARDTARS
jgi:cytochrome c oxidase assembly protein subunit 15